MTELLSYSPDLSIYVIIVLCVCKCLLTLIRYTYNIIITKMLLKNGKKHGKITKSGISF